MENFPIANFWIQNQEPSIRCRATQHAFLILYECLIASMLDINFLQKENIMNIYVGNLSKEVSEEDLRLAFEPFGTVESAAVIKDKFTGQSKGFGFVEMSSKEEGQSAIDELNGTELKGKPLTVNEARPRTENRGGRGGYGGNRGGQGGSRGGYSGGKGGQGGGNRGYGGGRGGQGRGR